MLTSRVVVGVDGPRGSCEVLETAVWRSVGRCAGDLSDEDIPDLVARGGPAELEDVTGFLQHKTYILYYYIELSHLRIYLWSDIYWRLKSKYKYYMRSRRLASSIVRSV